MHRRKLRLLLIVAGIVLAALLALAAFIPGPCACGEPNHDLMTAMSTQSFS